MSRGRVIWIVLDGVGLGALPDAGEYGDEDAATLPHVAHECGGLSLPNLQMLGLGNLVDISGVPAVADPKGAYGRMVERSVGKDSITGHWELAGVVLDKPFATFPGGFPAELIDALTDAAGGLAPLGNVPAGGLSILKTYGAEHIATERPILYTSVDSVLQIAAHEDILPPEELYELCRKARVLADDYNIARVIARPFVGNLEDGFRRTPGRKDFPVPPPNPTILELISASGKVVSGIGKISDLFSGKGLTTNQSTVDNADGMIKTLETLKSKESGLLMVNLIDFDMAYGHRGDAIGFGKALEAFDRWLPDLYSAMREEDLLMITADHGCDPTTPGTDHTREYVPVLAWAKRMKTGASLGDRGTFADVGATLAEFFDLKGSMSGESFLGQLNLDASL